MTGTVVAVDVGNSAIKMCLSKQSCSPVESRDASLVDHVIPWRQADWPALVIDWVRDQIAEQDSTAGNPTTGNPTTGNPVQWRIASVHRAAASRLCQALHDHEPQMQVHRVSYRDVPMPLHVEHPEQLGIDRLLGAHAARRRFGAPLVVVDAGSAVTIDWVDAYGGFGGGAILPGVELQVAVLAAETDALPKIDFRQTHPDRGPGRNTADAIRLGVLSGIAAAVDRLKNDYAHAASLAEHDVTTILTGGHARLISGSLRGPHQIVENLVCRGLLDLSGSEFRQPQSSDQLN